ncbi:MAG: peptide ABC transporter substrate-binding protein [Candidatus Baltobacteraceae bacterium]
MHRFLACALALLVAGCTKVGTQSDPQSPGGSGGRHPWTKPHVLRIGIQADANTMNTLISSNTTEAMLTRLTNDGLVTVDGHGRPVPMLAAEIPTLENGGISKDGLTLTYHLRRGVLWQDGVPFTSADVKFTYQAIMNSANNVISRQGYDLVRAVDTPDDHTVVFRMKQRFAPAVNTLFAESDSPYGIVPAHLLAKDANINRVPYNSKPIGTGPFILKDWARGDHMDFVANPHYFLGAPKLKEIIVKVIPDENTELNQLKTHEIDWQFEASPQEYAQLKGVSDLNIVLQDRNEYERLEINNRRPPLDDVRVRQSLAYAIDTKKLTDDLTYGSATPADQDLPPFMWAHAQNITRYPHDLVRAKALMAQAGWTPGPDGVLRKNGRRLSLEVTYNTSNATRRRGVVEVQAMLQQLGVDTSVKPYIATLLFAPLGLGGILQSGKYDLAWSGWVAGIDPDQSSLFLCRARPPNGNNTTFYCNARMDALQQTALTNFAQPIRKAAYAQIEALLTHDVPLIPLWWPRQIQPVNPDFKGFEPNPVTATWNAYQWDI